MPLCCLPRSAGTRVHVPTVVLVSMLWLVSTLCFSSRLTHTQVTPRLCFFPTVLYASQCISVAILLPRVGYVSAGCSNHFVNNLSQIPLTTTFSTEIPVLPHAPIQSWPDQRCTLVGSLPRLLNFAKPFRSMPLSTHSTNILNTLWHLSYLPLYSAFITVHENLSEHFSALPHLLPTRLPTYSLIMALSHDVD